MSKKGIIVLILVIIIIIVVVAGFAMYRNRTTEQKEGINGKGESNANEEVTTNEINNIGENNREEEEDNPKAESKIAIVYFSWAEHTEKMANVIANQTGGKLVTIEPVKSYPTDYNECTEVALEEKNKKERPEIKDFDVDLKEYDTIFVGYPNWWGDMPMVLYTFLENNDFSGKTVIPFMTSYSSGTSGTFNTIKNTLKSANVLEGIHVSQTKIDRDNYENEMIEWLNGLNY